MLRIDRRTGMCDCTFVTVGHGKGQAWVDDDSARRVRLIAGYRVLGPSNKIARVMQGQKVTDVIVCAVDLARGTEDGPEPTPGLGSANSHHSHGGSNPPVGGG